MDVFHNLPKMALIYIAAYFVQKDPASDDPFVYVHEYGKYTDELNIGDSDITRG